MPRASLPKNYLLSNGAVLEDFENINDWAIGSGTKEANTTIYKTGTQSVKISSPVGTNAFVTKTTSIDMSKGDIIEMLVYFEGHPNDTIAGLIVYLSPTVDFSSYYSRTTFATGLHKGWNRIRVSKEEWNITGTPTWSNPIVNFRVRINAAAGQVATAYFDSLTFGLKSIPKVLFHFDDAIKSVYTQAFPYMDAKGLSGTIYAIKNLTGSLSTFMTVSELAELYNKGWSIGNHTETHTNLSTYATQAEVEAELRNNKLWLDSLGFNRASLHVAYPQGGYNDKVLAAMNATGMKTGRTTVPRKQAAPVEDYRLLTVNGFSNLTTLAEAKGWVDQAIKTGGTTMLLLHDLVASPTIGVEWGIANFKALVDYVVSRRVDVVTIDEWYEGLTNPRYRSVPVSRTQT